MSDVGRRGIPGEVGVFAAGPGEAERVARRRAAAFAHADVGRGRPVGRAVGGLEIALVSSARTAPWQMLPAQAYLNANSHMMRRGQRTNPANAGPFFKKL